MEGQQVAGTGPLAAGRRGGRGVFLRRERQELLFRLAADGARQARVQKAEDRLEHLVWREGIAAVQPQHASGAEAHHDDPIGMEDDAGTTLQAEPGEPMRQLRRGIVCPHMATALPHSPWSPPATDTVTFDGSALANENASERWNSRPESSHR